MQEAAEGEVGQIELFLNSVPLLSPLNREAKLKLVDAFLEESFPAGTVIIREVGTAKACGHGCVGRMGWGPCLCQSALCTGSAWARLLLSRCTRPVKRYTCTPHPCSAG